MVVIQNFNDNKLNSHNFIDYGYRVFFLVFSEILFDWIKDIIIFKISVIKAKYLKTFTLEIAVFHEKLKNKCSYTNGGEDEKSLSQNSKETKNFNDYVNLLDNFRLKYFNKEKVEKFSYFVDFENLITIELQHNVMVICIIVKKLK